MSRPKPTGISLAISSGLLGSIVLVFFIVLDDDSPLDVVFWRFVPTCMVDELGGSDCFGSDEEDGGVVINSNGCTNFNGFVSVTFGVFLLDFLVEVLALGIFMVDKRK